MSNLPHPLGDTNPGEMFYPGSPDVLASDVPSAKGSRAVDFGEDGLSSAVNRGLYALAKNDEYQEARLEQDFARPELVTFTPAGGSGGNFTFSVDVWCGDTAYLPEDQNVRNGLISVLDQNYNDLVDPVSGDQIVVKEILDVPAGVSKVGVGFYTNPYITFRRMNPTTGALGADYTIPDGTKVWLAFGAKASLDQLVGGSSGSLQDAWFRGFTRSIGEIHAGSFLKDGSRVATGTFDMDSWPIHNISELFGYPDVTVHIKASGPGLGTLDLESVQKSVRFKDNWLPTYVHLNWGESSLVGDYNSMLGELNSKTRVAQAYYGNRLIAKTGIFTYTPGTGQIDWPELSVVIDGESRTIAAGNLIATNSAAPHLLVVNNVGTVVEKVQQSLVGDDIPLEVHIWNGAAFTTAFDVRWVYNGTSRNVEITCGSDPNADFGSTQLAEAIELACRFGYQSWQGAGIPCVRIMGSAFAPAASPYNIKLTSDIQIIGDGVGSTIYSDENNGHTVDMFECDDYMVIVKDLWILCSSVAQATTLGCFKNPGAWSIFENVNWSADFGTYGVGFGNAIIWDGSTGTAWNVRVDKCRAIGITHCFFNGSNAAFTSAYATEAIIRDCRLEQWGTVAKYGIVANGDGCIIQNVECRTGLDDYGIVAGNDTLIDRCKVRLSGAAGATPAGVYYAPLGTPAYHQGTIVRNCFFLRIPGAGILCSAINNASIMLDVKVLGCAFTEVDKPIDFNSVVAVHAGSNTVVDGCRFSDTSQFVAAYENVGKNKFINNVCDTTGGDGVYVRSGAGAHIDNNFFAGYGAAGTQGHVIAVDLGGWTVTITNNVIGNDGAPASSTQVDVWRKCTFRGNAVVGSANAEIGLQLNSYFWVMPFDLPAAVGNIVDGNIFDGHGTASIHVGLGTSAGATNGDQLIYGNTFSNLPFGGICVEVDGVSGVTIFGNSLEPMLGRAFYIHGTGATQGANCRISHNHLNAVVGAGGAGGAPRVIEVVGDGSSCHNVSITDNTLHECGAYDVSHYPLGNNCALIFAFGCHGYQINGNHIRQMGGYSGLADNSDDFYCIYVGGSPSRQGQINNNVFEHDFAVTFAPRYFRADKMYGIYIASTSYVQVVGNFFNWYGTQAGANLTDVVCCIQGNAGDYLMVSNNMSVGDWAIVGLTTTTSAFIRVDGDYCSVCGNITTGSSSIHSIWFGSAASGNGVAVGNVAGGSEVVSWNLSVTNLPDAVQYQNMNYGAVSHG